MTKPISGSQFDFLENIENVALMISFAPSINEQLKFPQKQKLAKAVYSSCVVLLSSYLERYVESVVVESVDILNTESVPTKSIPKTLKINQVKQHLDKLNGTIQQELNPNAIHSILEKSRDFVNDCSWFSNPDSVFTKFSPDNFINREKFSNPWPDKIDQVFLSFDIPKMVDNVINWENQPDSAALRIKVNELVEKRNDIAHTGGTIPITDNDIFEYDKYIRRLVIGIDHRVGEKIGKIIGKHPWKIIL